MQVLYITETGIAVPYLTSCLQYLHDKNQIVLRPYHLNRFKTWQREINTCDAMIYQYLRRENAPAQDDLFLNCNKFKLLFDSHDSGTIDKYPHLTPYGIPRIKNTPHKSIIASQNVVMSTTFPIKCIKSKSTRRHIDISFRTQLRNKARRTIRKLLIDYKKSGIVKHLRFKKDVRYPDYLTKVLISVNAPGNGEACIRHLLTLQAGACMLAHESINGIKLLPNADLVEGEDYISFNLSKIDLQTKLDWLLSHPNKLRQISENGKEKFITGYSVKLTADKLLHILRR